MDVVNLSLSLSHMDAHHQSSEGMQLTCAAAADNWAYSVQHGEMMMTSVLAAERPDCFSDSSPRRGALG